MRVQKGLRQKSQEYNMGHRKKHTLAALSSVTKIARETRLECATGGFRSCMYWRQYADPITILILAFQSRFSTSSTETKTGKRYLHSKMKPQINWYNQRNDCLSLGFMEGFFKGKKGRKRLKCFWGMCSLCLSLLQYFPSTKPSTSPRSKTTYGVWIKDLCNDIRRERERLSEKVDILLWFAFHVALPYSEIQDPNTA